MKYVLALLSSLSIYRRTVNVDVDFKMTELERPDRPLAGVPVRLVLGEVADWQGLSFPKRADHITVAAELEQLPHRQRRVSSSCSGCTLWTSSVIRHPIAPPPTSARFTRRGQPGPSLRNSPAGLKMPKLGGMILTGPGYKAADFFLSPAGPAQAVN